MFFIGASIWLVQFYRCIESFGLLLISHNDNLPLFFIISEIYEMFRNCEISISHLSLRLQLKVNQRLKCTG